ncbi:MAG: hypothetical protein WCA96_06250, partial [Methylocella sp.]
MPAGSGHAFFTETPAASRGQWLTFARALCLGFVLLFVRGSGGDKPFDINCPPGTIGRLAALDPL